MAIPSEAHSILAVSRALRGECRDEPAAWECNLRLDVRPRVGLSNHSAQAAEIETTDAIAGDDDHGVAHQRRLRARGAAVGARWHG